MKCPTCGIEMRLAERKDGAVVWICRNTNCPQGAKEKAKEDTHGTD